MKHYMTCACFDCETQATTRARWVEGDGTVTESIYWICDTCLNTKHLVEGRWLAVDEKP